jgi:hypothetical protein
MLGRDVGGAVLGMEDGTRVVGWEVGCGEKQGS